MWFAATYLFKIPEDRFWQLTPRQLAAFSAQYVNYQERKYSKGNEGRKAPVGQQGAAFIDQLF